jgi:diguanylate cyclase (GGDEF)-like protein
VSPERFEGSRPPDEHLVGAARDRMAEAPSGRDRVASTALGLLFGLGAIGAEATLKWTGPAHWPGFALLLVLAYALCSRVEFEIGPGCAVPTQLVFVPMWFVVPPAALPLAVAFGYVLGAVPEYVDGSVNWRRWLVLLGNSSYAFGPAIVLSHFAQGGPTIGQWPVYVGAFAAQVVCDAVPAAAREWFVFGHGPRGLAPFLIWVYGLDVLLTPAGISAAANGRAGFLLMLPVAALLAVLARDLRLRLDRSLTFKDAFDNAAQAARSDPLTGVGNRLAWDEALQLLQHDLRAEGKPQSIVLVDVDDLKLANDRHGHAVGDELLQAVAATLRDAVRGDDVVTRIGGDEFAILMRDTDASSCLERLSRLRRSFADRTLPDGHRVSATLGYGSTPPATSLGAAQEQADARLYDAKAARALPPDGEAAHSVLAFPRAAERA